MFCPLFIQSTEGNYHNYFSAKGTQRRRRSDFSGWDQTIPVTQLKMTRLILSFAMFWGTALGQSRVGQSASFKSLTLSPNYTSKYTTTAFIHKNNICVKEECIKVSSSKASNSQLQQENHSPLNNNDIVKSVLKTRGGASSSSYEGYNDSYGNDGNYDDDYYNRYDGYENRDGYGSSSPSSRDPYYDDYDFKGGRYAGERRSGYYDDEGRFHEDDDETRGSTSRRKHSVSRGKIPSSLPTVLTSGNRKLGTIFLASGAAFTALGITLFFNKTLMRLGNLLFVCGIPLMIGPGRTVGYFLQPKKARATGCLACGIFLVLVGHPVIGILLEIFGLLNLFGNMFPLVMMMAKNMPVVGGLFGGDSGNGGSGRREKRRRESEYDDRYYDDDRYYSERGARRNDRY
ncbi:hypothetical protein ACHAXS_002727 [Conticribra weissflogii]